MTAVELESSTPTFNMDERLVAGRYRLHDRIGSGRLGEIFAAFDESYSDSGVNQQLAIQIVPENIVDNNKLFNKLNVGYSALQAAAHPNIVRYLHFGRHRRRGFVVMELLDGASLRAVLETAETLPTDEVKPVIRGVGEALRFLHAQDTVHGNITTANVFLTGQLEVVLLDVLPIGAEQAVIRGGATSSRFSRCTVRDDVFGLACLAYEMLAGQHPFNHSPPAEASQAGLEPNRIDSLSDSEWDALRLALALDHEQRTASIEDFMRDFGVSRADRLRPVAAEPAPQKSPRYPAATSSPAVTAPAEPVRVSEPDVAIAAVAPVVPSTARAQKTRSTTSNARVRRTVLLGALLATLGAWFYYGQPREQIEALIDRSGETFVALPTVPDMAAPESVAGVELAPEISARADDDTTPAVPAEDENFARDELIAESPTSAPDESAAEEETSAIDEPAEIATGAPLAEAGVDQLESGPEVAFARPVISVSERDGAARIVAPNTGYSELPLVWWTSEHLARADEDFIAVPQQRLPAAANDGDSTLLVPLINDSVPEPPESFFVSLGFLDAGQGRIERIATIRVDIVDDD